MQGQYEPSGEAAVSNGERSFVVSLRVDWNRNGLYDHALSDMSRFVFSAVTDRALQGSSPQELGFVSGSAAAELTVVLSGEDSSGRSLAKIFSPYQIDSPFYTLEPVGCEITYSISIDSPVGLLTYPQFIGTIRTVSPDRASNNVIITALDRVEALRKPVQFPPWAISEQQASQGRVLAQLMQSHYVIDHALRQCNTSTSPYRPITVSEIGDGSTTSGTQVFITGNGGKTSVVGWEDNPTRQEYPDTEHGVLMYEAIGETHPQAPYPSVKPRVFAGVGTRSDQDLLIYWVRDRDGINSLASNVSGFTLIQGGAQDGSYWSTMADTKVCAFRTRDEIEIQIWMGSGNVWTEWDRTGAGAAHFVGNTVAIPSDGIVHIHVCWDAFHPAGPKYYVSANANNSGVQTAGGPVAFVSTDDELAGLVEISRVVAMQDIYFTTTNFGSVGDGTAYRPKVAKYAASVDQGLNRLSFMPIRDKPEAWEVIKSVADAEMGSAFWDEQGRFVFWNFDTLMSKQSTIVRQISLDDVTNLSFTRDLDSVRNSYAMDQGKARTVIGNVYESQDVNEFVVPAGTRKRFKLYVADGVSPEPRLMDRYKDVSADPVPAWRDHVFHGYVFQWFNGTSWNEAVTGNTSGVDILAYYDQDGFIIVNIWNGWAQPIRLAKGNDPDSTPAFNLGGSFINKYDNKTEVTKDTVSIAKYDERVFSLSGDWFQDQSNATNVLSKFLDYTVSPKPSSDAISIAGDPRLQLGDTLRILDKPGFGEYFDVQIYGIRREFSVDSGLTDNLSVHLVAAGGKWDDPIYGIWDSTFIWT